MSKFIIVATDLKNGFGKDGKIPWNISEDMMFFKEKTQNHTCVMGFKTFVDMAKMRKFPEKNKILLPNRKSIVFSKEKIDIPNVMVVTNKKEIIELKDENIAFIGGNSIFNFLLDYKLIEELYVTQIKKDFNCDVFFDLDKLKINSKRQNILNENNILRINHFEI